MDADIVQRDLRGEKWREYIWETTPSSEQNRLVHIGDPQTLFYREGGTTHRILTSNGIVMLVPAPGHFGCYVRYQPRDVQEPVAF